MEEILKADIFFFITSVAVVVVGLLATIALLLLIKILRDVREIADIAKSEVHGLQQDFANVRKDVKSGVRATKAFVTGAGVKQALMFLMNTITDAASQRRRRSSRKKSDD